MKPLQRARMFVVPGMLVWLAAAGSGCEQTGGMAPPPVGAVTGSVFNQTTGAAVGGTNIALRREGYATHTAQSNSTGSITFLHVGAGDWTATITIPNALNLRLAPDETGTRTVSVGESATAQMDPFRLVPAPTGSLAGVISVGTIGVRDAIVRLTGPATRTDTTDAAGAYSFTDLNPGSYTVTLTPPSGFAITASQTAARTAVIAAGQTTTIGWSVEGTGGVVEIRLTDGVFEPETVEITRGTTVRWINTQDVAHTITPQNAAQAGVWARAELTTEGQVFEHIFTVSGQTYRYRSEPFSTGFTSGMLGTITVQ